MRAKRIWGGILIVIGVLLLGASLFLLLYNQRQAEKAEASASAVMEKLAVEIQTSALTTNVPVTAAEELPPEALKTEMDTVEIDGFDYIGFLTIPDLNLELPVMAEWDYDRLKIAPCRYTGTLLGRDLVIAAHNYLRHFGHLMDLYPGAELTFTDVHGMSTLYRIAEIEILEPTEVEKMSAGEYDLTLFTCTYGGATRFTIRCDVAKD